MYKQQDEENFSKYLTALNTTYNIPLLKEFTSVRHLSDLSNPGPPKPSLPTRSDFENKMRLKNAKV